MHTYIHIYTLEEAQERKIQEVKTKKVEWSFSPAFVPYWYITCLLRVLDSFGFGVQLILIEGKIYAKETYVTRSTKVI